MSGYKKWITTSGSIDPVHDCTSMQFYLSIGTVGWRAWETDKRWDVIQHWPWGGIDGVLVCDERW